MADTEEAEEARKEETMLDGVVIEGGVGGVTEEGGVEGEGRERDTMATRYQTFGEARLPGTVIGGLLQGSGVSDCSASVSTQVVEGLSMEAKAAGW